jgi:serine/threonine-protein kinase
MSPALATDPEFKRRFFQEVASSAKLAHPNIVKIFDTNEHDSCLCIAMEYMDGGTLAE